MKVTLTSMGKNVKALGSVLSLGALILLLSAAGCATSGHNDQSAGERVDDRATSSRVRDALSADPLYKLGGVNVETYRGTVQLSGFVTASAQRTRAADLATRVEGVREVANNITVKEPAN